MRDAGAAAGAPALTSVCGGQKVNVDVDLGFKGMALLSASEGALLLLCAPQLRWRRLPSVVVLCALRGARPAAHVVLRNKKTTIIETSSLFSPTQHKNTGTLAAHDDAKAGAACPNRAVFTGLTRTVSDTLTLPCTLVASSVRLDVTAAKGGGDAFRQSSLRLPVRAAGCAPCV